MAHDMRNPDPVRTATMRAPGVAIVIALLTAASVRAEPVKPIDLRASRDGEHTVFTVALARPDDLAELSIERFRLEPKRPAWPRLVELRGTPVWQVPCYLEFERPEEYHPASHQDPLRFIGRCPANRTSVELALRHRTTGGEGVERPLTLDLAGAEPLPAEPGPLKRFAAAQAAWFELVREHAGDMGGFWTFAAEQTRLRYGLAGEEPETTRPTQRFWRPEDQLYNVTTGALAVQESLQLDRMTAGDRDADERSVPLADIQGVTVRSHPFDRMRGDKEPVHSALAQLAPENFYYVRFGSVAQFYALLDFSELWGASLLRLASPVGTDYDVRARFHRQLCLPETALARLLGPAVIEELALVGSDPYVVEGSDLSVLLRPKNRAAFQLAVDPLFAQARGEFPDAVHDTTTHAGVSIERLVDPQRRVSCHRCWLDDVCVYSNSLAALQRIIDVHNGAVPNLAAAADFRYMRAVVFPLDSQQEDGFLYLSDAFIRRLVGPELRIQQKRRLEVVTSLKMIANAALLHGYEFGPGQPALDVLYTTRVLRPTDVFDPDGGRFTWDAAAGIAGNSTYGDLRFLTPLIEISADRATPRERDAYAEFRQRYQDYWQRYFDPIGVRIRMQPTLRIETCILPLIDMSEYEQFQDLAGGAPITVEPDRFVPGTLLRTVMKFNDGTLKSQIGGTLSALGFSVATDWLGDWVTFWVEDTDAFETLVRTAYERENSQSDEAMAAARTATLNVFNATFVGGVQVRNKLSLATFLVGLRGIIQQTAPNMVVFNNLPEYRGVTIVQVAPDPTGDLGRELRSATQSAGPEMNERPGDNEQAGVPAAATQPVSEAGPALYYAAIGDGFYVSTQAAALRRLIDQVQRSPTSAAAAPGSATSAPDRAAPAASTHAPVQANLLLYAAPQAVERIRPTVSYLLEQQARRVSLHNLAQVWLLGRCGTLERLPLDVAARHYLGYRLVCPDGGDYRYDPAAVEAIGSVHGPLSKPRTLDTPPPGSPLNDLLATVRSVVASLRFTEDGVSTTVEIVRP